MLPFSQTINSAASRTAMKFRRRPSQCPQLRDRVRQRLVRGIQLASLSGALTPATAEDHVVVCAGPLIRS